MTNHDDKYDERLTTLDPPCMYCKHRRTIGQQGIPFDGWTCSAFPEGIPYGILSRETPHTEVFEDFQEGTDVYESEVFDYPDGRNVISFDGIWSKPKAK